MTTPAPPRDLTLPADMAGLPVDKHGRPVPWFVAWIDGKPDFRVVGPDKVTDAVRFSRCWVCGRQRGRWGTFVIGPMCAVNRISAEPPSHAECADFSARACPFLTRPNMVRRESNKPEGVQDPAGHMIRRNPGVSLLWKSRSWRQRRDGLFDVGDPDGGVRWLCRGRDATRDEVVEAIDSGLPTLHEAAEDEGRAAVAELERLHARALALLPEATR